MKLSSLGHLVWLSLNGATDQRQITTWNLVLQ